MAGLYRAAHLCALLCVALAARASAIAQDAALRGLHPGTEPLFVGSESFQCDGGKKHPISAFNDDFCDCSDGIDEPGEVLAELLAWEGRGGNLL